MAVKFWEAPQGDWSTASNWNPNGIPKVGDLDIDQGGNIIANSVGFVSQTIWLDWNATTPVSLALMGSSIGPGSLLLSNADKGNITVLFHNSALQGSIFAGSGALDTTVDEGSAAVNYGWIGVADQQPSASMDITAYGDFGNEGLIEAGQYGQFTLGYGFKHQQTVWSTGIVQADAGGMIRLYSGMLGTNNDSVFLSLGQINARGANANVYVTSNLLMSPTATVNISQGGNVELDGATAGGTINIDTGKLTFGTENGIGFIGAADFQSTISFLGGDAELDFSAPVFDTYDSATNSLLIRGRFGNQIADLRLGGTYFQDEFTANGDKIMFHQLQS